MCVFVKETSSLCFFPISVATQHCFFCPAPSLVSSESLCIGGRVGGFSLLALTEGSRHCRASGKHRTSQSLRYQMKRKSSSSLSLSSSSSSPSSNSSMFAHFIVVGLAFAFSFPSPPPLSLFFFLPLSSLPSFSLLLLP